MFKQLTIAATMTTLLGIGGLSSSEKVEVVQVFPRVELIRAETSKDQLKAYFMHQLRQSSLKENEIEEGLDGLSKATTTAEVKEVYGKYAQIELDRIQQKRDEEEKAKKAEEERIAKEKAEEEAKAKKAEEERIAKEKSEQEAKAQAEEQAQAQPTYSGSSASNSGVKISLSQFMFDGVVYSGGFKFTYYSQSVLPGGGLSIPGRHVNADGFVSDGDGYIVLAGSAPLGTVYDTPFGYKGKIYDRGTYGNHLDVYVR
jgi:hypothetical protein